MSILEQVLSLYSECDSKLKILESKGRSPFNVPECHNIFSGLDIKKEKYQNISTPKRKYPNVYNYVCKYLVSDANDYKESALDRITSKLVTTVSKIENEYIVANILYAHVQFPICIENKSNVITQLNEREFISAVKQDTGIQL